MARRYFFHNFARPKGGEDSEQTLERSLRILSFMQEVGLVLAPEVVTWNIITPDGSNEMAILQRRACFTEIAKEELGDHSKIFGPLALAFDIENLRSAGATPVIYVPQGLKENSLSRINEACCYGVYHTKKLLEVLQNIRNACDAEAVAASQNLAVTYDYTLNLRNTDPSGAVVAAYAIPSQSIRDFLKYIGYKAIPFDHSIGVLATYLNMYYPTDNSHTGDLLGYYRQREWRLIAGDIAFNGRPLGRNLTDVERERLESIDERFWKRQLTVDGVTKSRSQWAVVYDPAPDWRFGDIIEAIHVPASSSEKVRCVVGDSVKIEIYG